MHQHTALRRERFLIPIKNKQLFWWVCVYTDYSQIVNFYSSSTVYKRKTKPNSSLFFLFIYMLVYYFISFFIIIYIQVNYKLFDLLLKNK